MAKAPTMPMDANTPRLPATPEEYCSRGMDRLEAGDVRDAIDDFTQAIKLRPDIAAGYRFRAMAHAELGNVPRAIADLDQAIRLKPDDIQALLNRGTFFLRQKQYDEALADCNRALAIDAARADLIALRGRVNEARGASEMADADFSAAIEMDPGHAAEYLVWRGDLRLKSDELVAAIDDFDAALRINDANVYALSRRASAHWANHDLDAALRDFTRAVDLDVDWVWVRNGRGLVLHDLGKYDAALADFDKALELDHGHGPTFEYRFETLHKLGRKDDVMAALNEAIKRNPESPRLFNRRAMMHYFNREYPKAVRDHTAALKCDPANATTFNYLGWVWATAPDPTVRNGRRALECATRACELTEWQTPGFLDTLAAAHAEVGNFPEAEKWADRAHDVAEDDKTRNEYAARAEQYRNRTPLRVNPADLEG